MMKKMLRILAGLLAVTALAPTSFAAGQKRPRALSVARPQGAKPELTVDRRTKAIQLTSQAGARATAVVAVTLAGDPVLNVTGADEGIDGDGISFGVSVTAGDTDLAPFTLEVEYSEGLGNLGLDPQGWDCTFGSPGHATCEWLTTLAAGDTTATATLSGFAAPPYGGAAECDPGRSPCAFLRASVTGVASGVKTTAMVVGNNHPPVAADDTAAVPTPLVPITIDVLPNDTDADFDFLTVSLVAAPASGAVAIDPTRRFVYTPGPSFPGSDSFRYRITDPLGATATATVTIGQLAGTVGFQSPVLDVGNVEPGRVVNRLNFFENSTGLDLLGEVRIDPLDPSEFAALLAGTPYDPAQAVSDVSVFVGGGVMFSGSLPVVGYGVPCKVNPPVGRVWLARVNVTLTPITMPSTTLHASYVVVARGADVSELPVRVVDDVAITPVDTPIVVHPLDNDTSASGDPLSVTSIAIGEPFHYPPPWVEGTVEFAEGQGPGGGVPYLGALFVPTPGFTGTTSFYYAASETPGGQINGRYDYAKVTVIVGNAGNHAPVAHAQTASVVHDRSLSFSLSALATDVDGDPLTIEIVTPPTHGTATVLPTGDVRYDPAPQYVGPDSFQFRANDGTAFSNIAGASITVTNAAPVAQDRSATILHDTSAGYWPVALGSDADNDPLAIRVVTPAAHGTAYVAVTGGLVYQPAAHFVGTDSFRLVLNDGIADSNVATITMTVTNAAPVAQNRSATILHDTSISYFPSILGIDADGDPFTIRIVSPPAHGAADIVVTGAVRYTPAAHFAGSDSFQYVLSDGISDSNVATIAITVTNAAPVAQNRSATISHDTSTSYFPSILGSDADNDPFTIRVVSAPAHGTADIVVTGAVRYTPAPRFVGSDSFQYVLNDGVADSNVAPIAITVTNAAPVLNPVAAQTVAEMAGAGFTATASDADGDALTFSLVGAPPGAQITSAGLFSWTPTEAQGPGTYTFGVRATDTTSAFDEDPVTITVTEVNAAPTLTLPSLPATIGAGTPFTFTATAADSDLPANALAFSLAGAPAGATIAAASCAFSWTPSVAQAGSSFTFSVVVTDNGSPAASRQQSVTVAVDAVSATPALLVSLAADRSSPQPLAGQALAGLAYVFVTPNTGITRVRFWLDNPSRSGPPRQVENAPPFDFSGTAANGSAQPFDTRGVGNGTHVVSAEVTLSSGPIVQLQGSFTVNNTTPQLFVSTSPSRSMPRALQGATVRNRIYVFVQPDPDAVRVRFWLDTPTTQPAFHVETSAPYDFVGTAANGNAAPFDTRSISRGQHVVRATIDYAGGASVTTTAVFLVTR